MNKTSRMTRFVKWFFFGLIFGLAPLIGDYLVQSVHPMPSLPPVGWSDVFGRGELLLVCAGIVGAGVGELIGSGREWLVFKLICGGASVVILFVAVTLYSNIASDLRLGASYDRVALISKSIYLFIATVIFSVGCILSGED